MGYGPLISSVDGPRLPEIHCGGLARLAGRWDRAGFWFRFGVAFEMEHQKLNSAPACVSHNINARITARHIDCTGSRARVV